MGAIRLSKFFFNYEKDVLNSNELNFDFHYKNSELDDELIEVTKAKCTNHKNINLTKLNYNHPFTSLLILLSYFDSRGLFYIGYIERGYIMNILNLSSADLNYDVAFKIDTISIGNLARFRTSCMAICKYYTSSYTHRTISVFISNSIIFHKLNAHYHDKKQLEIIFIAINKDVPTYYIDKNWLKNSDLNVLLNTLMAYALLNGIKVVVTDRIFQQFSETLWEPEFNSMEEKTEFSRMLAKIFYNGEQKQENWKELRAIHSEVASSPF